MRTGAPAPRGKSRPRIRAPRDSRGFVQGLPAVAVTLFCILGLAAVAAGGDGDEGRRTLQVFAASSLADAFRDMEAAFEASHPRTNVELVFAGSQILRLQIEQGARADVFASADRRHIESLARAGLLAEYVEFANNELAVIVPLDNPAGIESFDDLPHAERLVIGTEHVPVGAYTHAALRRAAARNGPGFETAVLDRVVSRESNVRLVRAKVELGVADAAIVYRTDAAPGRVRTIAVPPWANVRAGYLTGAVAGSANPEGAEQWIRFVASPAGREILSRRGFRAGSAPAW